ncbi:MAG: hypothetical protein M3N49_11350, partial [Candidatus Eremiobacteraeota bacterium]|nr:hypothetical protein [Candidatus Eremiobacteraeota bacterium]
MRSTSRDMIGWEAGSSAQLELFSPRSQAAGANVYQLKYSPPLRTTIRPPTSELVLGPNELDPITQNLNKLVRVVRARGAKGAQAVA